MDTANAFSMTGASELNNQAIQLEYSGDFAGAERKYIEALRMKISASGEQSIGVALTKNALGELYLTTGQLDKAQVMLEAADDIRSSLNPDFDEACTKDNVGRLWEMKGELEKARQWREKLAPNRMICSHFNCPKSGNNQFSKRSELSVCIRCKCAFYCGKECQTKDWRRHKKFCKKPSADATSG